MGRHDRTAEFDGLWVSACSSMVSGDSNRRCAVDDRRQRPLQKRINPFADSLGNVEAAFERAIEDAGTVIVHAITVIDDTTSTAAAREAAADALMISDVSLQAVGSSIRQLLSAVEKADNVLAKRLLKREGRDLLEHTFNALAALMERVGQRRVAVALAREEVDRHRTLLIRASKAMVLRWPDDNEPSPEEHRVVGRSTTGIAAPSAEHAKCEPQSKAAAAVATFANSTSAHVLAFTRNVVSSNRGAGPKRPSLSNSNNNGDTVRASCSYWTAQDADHAIQQLDKERLEQLQQEHQRLVEAQENSSAAAARKIESSVRELTILTAILNEQVALQGEKLVLVERDTTASQSNLAKAATQLTEPLLAMWSPKRMLAAVLFICSALMLIFNRIIR